MFNFIGKALAQTVPIIHQVPSGTLFGDTVLFIINVALYVGGGIAVLFLIYGGISYTTAGGDPEQATKAKTVIVNAIIGVVIMAFALVLVNWVAGAILHGTSGTQTPLNF